MRSLDSVAKTGPAKTGPAGPLATAMYGICHPIETATAVPQCILFVWLTCFNFHYLVLAGTAYTK